MQTTSHLLMIRPVRFGFNEQTAVNNAFQVAGEQEKVQESAVKEFDDFVEKLRAEDIDVMVVNDSDRPHTPDSIFPNNWISFHNDGRVFLYPMFAENRRLERKPEVIETIKRRFEINQTIDLSVFESENKFLEGTGSMVLDRESKIAYACLSPRTDKELFELFCRKAGYKPVSFRSIDENGRDIYHTNVMMCVADKYVVICLSSIPDSNELKQVTDAIISSGKKIIEISFDQVNHFAGNMLQVNNKTGEKFLVMSSQAYSALTTEQANELSSYNRIIHSNLETIERNGGGSARCMMAEVHLRQKDNH
jgi:hypothetical protein